MNLWVSVEHPWGSFAMPLDDWIASGPVARPLLRPSSVIDQDTGTIYPVSKIPLRYRNSTWSRWLIRMGLFKNPWPV
ncbi:MAG TPA: hypothetical protein VHB50_01050 [Bryobacteraceae bacterium]|nr:hypothetical protein [Bryobacteraceae bacterium]